jgi:PAS domain S-box-containing protein
MPIPPLLGDPLAGFRALAKNSGYKKSITLNPSDRVHFEEHEILVSRTDRRGVINYCNQTFQKIAGFTAEELIGQPHNLVRHPFMPRSAFEDLWKTIKQESIWQGLVVNATKDGQGYYWVLATVYPDYVAGEHSGYISVRVVPNDDLVKEAESLYPFLR